MRKITFQRKSSSREGISGEGARENLCAEESYGIECILDLYLPSYIIKTTQYIILFNYYVKVYF